MKRLVATILLFIVCLWSVPVVPVSAQGVAAQGVGAGASDECDTWFAAPLHCAVPAIVKAAKGAMNKQGADIGAASFAMTQMLITGFGLCDSQCNPNCPKGVSYQNSAMAGLSKSTLAMYENPPADTRTYIADLGKTLGFMPKAQAQGIGFSGLNGLLGLWKAFRNIAYALLSIILIAVGFMVMFRKKIDPKTVVTVQNAIPRIVVALILVTFSYAIVGLMIDLMYLTIILFTSVIAGAAPSLGQAVSIFSGKGSCVPVAGGVQINGPTASTTEVTSILFNGGIGRLLGFFMGSGFQAWDDIAAMMTNGFQATEGWMILGGVVGAFIGGWKGTAIGIMGAPILLALIILIVMLFGFIRLLFMLIDAYINIIISLLTAPFHLMMEAVPGSNAFSSWFRNLLSKIIVFPLTAVLLLISAVLTSQSTATTIWAPPLLSSGGGAYGMAGLIGLGMLLVIPNVVMGIQKSLKAEALIPGGVGPILGPFGQGVGQIVQLWYQGSFIASGMRHKPDTRSPLQTAREGAEKGFGSISGSGGGGH